MNKEESQCGAIIGILSVYLDGTISNKGLLYLERDCFLDDTVMTCAVAEAIMNGGQKTISFDFDEIYVECIRYGAVISV